MIDIATYVRIFDPDPSDELVIKRSAAIKALAMHYGESRSVAAILQDANDIAGAVEAKGNVSSAMAGVIEAFVRKGGADAFVAEGQDLQVKVCALLAALQLVEATAPTTGDVTSVTVLAIGLWSALSFQARLAETKLEKLRADLLQVAHQYVIQSASSSRQRAEVPDINISAADPFDAANVAKSTNNGLKSAFNKLRANAAIDREELDLLWWVLSDWSTLRDRRYSSVTNPIAVALATGIEAGQMLRRLPGDAHRNLVLRHVKGGEPLSLGDAVKSLGDDCALLAQGVPNHNIVAMCPMVFPLLAAVTSGSAPQHPRAKHKRATSEWAARALLETAAVHVTSLLPPKD